ncbi:P-loop containing nucleoside triphosphate hydrolase protein [Gymnopilus junonius]|uniref:P-loop containing nucleoside triphosphate hydrolase protein n=1 Tax=Gymnopilus junonius TaxID=109634 RepID=A0A9P5NKN1_GYMJU|nr:P-loop containing nucleoside triphosphate hydrolase protein [Gymnopilus junonius]
MSAGDHAGLVYKEIKGINEFKKDDLIIIIMGGTGAGKSTFVNTLLGEDRVKVGYGLRSCTNEIERVDVPSFTRRPQGRGCRLALIDTPGFDATDKDDLQILYRIAACVKDIYINKEVLGGIIYLHDISDDRLSAAAHTHLSLLKNFCGVTALKNVVLGTTKWSKVTEGRGLEREKELKERYWGPLIAMGSTVEKFDGKRESASRIVENILDRIGSPGIVLDIQRELVEEKKDVSETGAGTTLKREGLDKVKKEKEGLFRRIRRFFGI